MIRLILGSASPRRKEIMGYFSYPFEQVAPDFPEHTLPFTGDAAAYVVALAESKAGVLVPKYPKAAILSADTIVVLGEKIFGKPQDAAHARVMLQELSGRWHSVFTGVAVAFEGKTYSSFEETRVLFNALNEEQITEYMEQLHLFDKAGAYLIQAAGSLIVSRIDGCYYNVVGLPINTVRKLLQRIGIDLWHYLA